MNSTNARIERRQTGLRCRHRNCFSLDVGTNERLQPDRQTDGALGGNGWNSSCRNGLTFRIFPNDIKLRNSWLHQNEWMLFVASTDTRGTAVPPRINSSAPSKLLSSMRTSSDLLLYLSSLRHQLIAFIIFIHCHRQKQRNVQDVVSLCRGSTFGGKKKKLRSNLDSPKEQYSRRHLHIFCLFVSVSDIRSTCPECQRR